MNKALAWSFAAAGMLSASTACAGGQEILPIPDFFTGFYVGGTGAVHHVHFNSTAAINVPEAVSETVVLPDGSIVTATVLGAGSFINNDASGGDFAGYGGVQGGGGKVFNQRWYIGIVGFSEWGNNSKNSSLEAFGSRAFHGQFSNETIEVKTSNQVTSSTTSKLENDYGVAAKLGFLVAPRSMIYGKIGAIWATEKVSSTITAEGDVNFVDQITLDATGRTFGTASSSDTKLALLLAAGFEQFIYQNIVSVNAEFDYANFGTVNATAGLEGNGSVTINGQTLGPSPTVPIPAAFTTASASAKMTNFLVGLNFYFGHGWL